MGMELLILATIAGVMAFALAKNAYGLGQMLGVMDYPDNGGGRKLHKQPTPLVGGIVSIVPGLIYLLWAGASTSSSVFLTLFLGVSAFLVLGLIDDRNNVKPVYRLVFSGLIVALALASEPEFGLSFLKFGFLNYTFFLEGWSVLLTILCVVGLQNAVNMADGSNGLVIGMSILWSIALMLYAPTVLLPLLLITLVALVVALVFNWKSRLFLGDSGSYALSVYFGFLAIYTYNHSFTSLSAEAVALLFLVPVLDCIRLMVSRVVRGRSPFHADREHMHHYLQDAMPWSLGLGFYLALVGVPSLVVYVFPALALNMVFATCLAYLGVLGALSFVRNRNARQVAE